jgi:hypothetical protein
MGILGSSALPWYLTCFVPWRTYTPLRKEYAAFVTWPTDAA